MEKYVIEKVVGEGTYGIVYRATEKVSVVLAVIRTMCEAYLEREEGNK